MFSLFLNILLLGDCMFYKYEIRNINNQEVLYLYLSLKYEFSNEFVDDNNLKILSKDFIKTNNITFRGSLVYYVIDGIIVKKVNLLDDNNISDDYSPDKFLINIRLEDNSMCEITLRDYLLSCLFFFYSNDIDNEVLKCICILYNTYAYKQMKEDNFISSNNSFTKYEYHSNYRDKYNNYSDLINRFNNIINSVSCIYLSYNNNYILPFMHYSNSGRTLTNGKYPYLSSVKSLWDICASTYVNINDYYYDELSKKFNSNINESNISVIDNGQYIKIGNNKYSILEIKNILKLNSNDITLIINSNYVRFVTKGIGNSLGMSLYGACSIEKNGGKYFNILNYYFPKVRICRYIKELSK